ncbi:MAG TPA: sugar transferase [Verrucomicrobiota bacterium]|nr:sugar transferase [Verrucomicrobiota bacterium]
MLSRHTRLRTQLQIVLDAVLFGLSLYLAHLLRTHWRLEVFGGTKDIQGLESYVWLFPLVMVGGPFLLRSIGFYNRPFLPSRRLTAWQLIKGCVYATIGLIIVIFVVRQGGEIGRSVIILFGLISFGVISVKEEVVLQWRTGRLGGAPREMRLILVGTTEDTARLRQDLSRSQREELNIVAQLSINERPVSDLVELMHVHSANGVVLTAKHTYLGQIEQAIELCEREGVEVWLLADFFKTQISRTGVDDFYGRPMLVFRSGPDTSWPLAVKRLIDFWGSLLLLVLLGPLMLLVGLIIKLGSPGPALFRQQRSGLNGRPFTMLKFRSMVTDAEQRKQELALLNEMSGPVFKVTNDPRVTPVGRFIRKWSIDELPQLINVLRGEMSLVGPRPLPVAEVARFDDLAHRRRLSVRPGLTCLWQVNGRNEVRDFRDWVRLDLEYIDNWSLWLDLKILLRTIPAVLTAAGAK